MLGAYILIWAIPLAFLWSSHRRLNGLEEDLHSLTSMRPSTPGAGDVMEESLPSIVDGPHFANKADLYLPGLSQLILQHFRDFVG